MSTSLISYVIYDIYGLMDVGWVWLFSIIVGMAGHHLKLSTTNTALIGGIIMAITADFFFTLAPNWQLADMLLFFSTSYNFVLGVSIFLVGAGISYATYYGLSAMSGGKEKD